ncbi:MAG: hypothetical protein R3F59_02480 [Myxococcota bacterium]
MNKRALDKVFDRVKAIWRYWLDRRSQKANMTWQRFGASEAPAAPEAAGGALGLPDRVANAVHEEPDAEIRTSGSGAGG